MNIEPLVTHEYLAMLNKILSGELIHGAHGYLIGFVSALAWKDGWTPDSELLQDVIRIPAGNNRILLAYDHYLRWEAAQMARAARRENR